MSEQDPIWSSHPNISRTLPQETQPSPRLTAAALKRSSRRKPIGLYALTGVLAVIVLLCVSLSVVLASIGPGTLLALRDRWLGRNLQETVSTIGQVAQVIVAEHDVWPAPDNGRVTILLLGIDARDKLNEGASRTDVLTLVDRQLASHEITVVTHLDSSNPEVAGSSENLKQVFLNLIINARDAMSSGGTLEISSWADGLGARISVLAE